MYIIKHISKTTNFKILWFGREKVHTRLPSSVQKAQSRADLQHVCLQYVGIPFHINKQYIFHTKHYVPFHHASICCEHLKFTVTLDFIVEFHPLCSHTVSRLQLYEHIMGPVENTERKGTLLLMPLSGWVKQATLV